MKLYFSPLSCSLSSRIALYEAGKPAELIEVDAKTKRTSDGRDFRAVNPLGLVPTLELDDGSVLTENAAILQLLAPQPSTPALQQWLSFVGSELHKHFVPLLDKDAPADAKAYAEGKLRSRLAHANEHLATRPYLLGEPSVADGYLFAVLNWTAVVPVKLAEYPALAAFHARMLARPAVARAFGEERALYVEEQKRAS